MGRSASSPLVDPRVTADVYVVRPSCYDGMVNSDRDMWCLHVVNGHAYGWSVRRGANSPVAMNRKGQWIVESGGSGRNRPRRWPLDDALALALAHVDTHSINGLTAAEANAEMATRTGGGDG